MARPSKDFDKNLFEDFCKIQCTQLEICALFKTTDKTLTAWIKRTYKLSFSEAYKRFSEHGKMSLRRAMFKKAVVDGNATMQIWLSKQHLGMSDKIVQENKDYSYDDPAFLSVDETTS